MKEERIASTTRLVVYDGDCRMCRAAIKVLVRLGVADASRCRTYATLEGKWCTAVAAAGIGGEIAVVDEATGKIRMGADGLNWLARGSLLAPIAIVLGLPVVRALARCAYRLVSYNRRILAPPVKATAECACEPPLHLGYRSAFIGLNIAAATLLTGCLGAILAIETGSWTTAHGALAMIAVAGGGWLLLMVASFALSTAQRWEYLGHLTCTMVVGLILLVPAMLASVRVAPPASLWLLGVSVPLSAIAMGRMQWRRNARIGLSRRWSRGWVVALIGSAAAVAAAAIFLHGGWTCAH